MLTFYFTIGVDELRPYMPDVPVLSAASSYARRGLRPPALPSHVKQRAADSGGFVATFKWGDYRYTPNQYKAWLDTWHPQWAAMMAYKAELVGIRVIITEESSTSKCSFLDHEPIGKHETSAGKRVKRGLFRASDGRLINADVNGSANIILMLS